LGSTVQVLTVSGSLQAVSANRTVLALAEQIAPPGTTFVHWPSPASIPHFDPDLDGGEPVTEWRATVAAADVVLIATPEYGHSVPGSLKNALDWLIGSGELYEKPVAILGATPRHGGGALGRAALEQTLRAQGAEVRSSASVLVRRGEEPDEDAIALVGAALVSLTS
jgi:NAD(P)H-dependent FMN reductase